MSKTKKTAHPHLRLVPRPHPAPGLMSHPPFQPRSKADWLLINLFPDDPEFPLHPELEAQIPKDLPGEVPQSLMELYAASPVASSKSPSRRAARSVARSDV